MIYSENYWKIFEESMPTIKNIEQIKNSSILITGSTGLIGSCIVDLLIFLNNLNYNIKIYAAARNEQSVKKRFGIYYSKINFIYYDALKPIEFDFDIDYIIHAASNANPKYYSAQPVETMLANLEGMNNILKYSKEKKSRVLYISSSEVYGKKNTSKPYTEEDYSYLDILNPRACYPSSKRAAETLCSSYKQEYGVDFVIVRPGHIYGPTMTINDNRAYAQFARNACLKQDIIMKSSGTQLRSYCYVSDCATAILSVLINGQSGESYNISNPDSIISIRQLAECIAKVANVTIVFENASDSEKSSYNLMDNSSLNSEKLEKLDWRGMVGAELGTKLMLELMEK